MNHTTRTYPRTLREAFHEFGETCIGITGPVVIPTRPPWWARVLRRLLRTDEVVARRR